MIKVFSNEGLVSASRAPKVTQVVDLDMVLPPHARLPCVTSWARAQRALVICEATLLPLPDPSAHHVKLFPYIFARTEGAQQLPNPSAHLMQFHDIFACTEGEGGAPKSPKYGPGAECLAKALAQAGAHMAETQSSSETSRQSRGGRKWNRKVSSIIATAQDLEALLAVPCDGASSTQVDRLALLRTCLSTSARFASLPSLLQCTCCRWPRPGEWLSTACPISVGNTVLKPDEAMFATMLFDCLFACF